MDIREIFEAPAGFSEPSCTFVAQPVTSLDDKRARLQLIRSRRVGPVTFRRLLAEHGTAASALEALPEIAASAGVSKYEIAPDRMIDAEIRTARRIGARLLCLGDPDYPAPLAQIADAPPVIWSLGDRSLTARPMVALVGTRNASSLGGRMARALAHGLGEAGIVTVSGLARGIDTAVHTASLDTGTIAVQAGGVDVIYPTENTKLADDIATRGLRLAEGPLGVHPTARDFPKRNRIISGLGLVVVVVEAATRSGSMLTATNALDQGREVLAVPGHPMEGRASGCNQLIRDGARMVRDVDDILAALPIAPQADAIPPETHPPMPDAQVAKAILSHLSQNAVDQAQLFLDLDLPADAATGVLTDLELAGRVSRDSGGVLSTVT